MRFKDNEFDDPRVIFQSNYAPFNGACRELADMDFEPLDSFNIFVDDEIHRALLSLKPGKGPILFLCMSCLSTERFPKPWKILILRRDKSTW